MKNTVVAKLAAVAALGLAPALFAETYLPGEGSVDVAVYQTTGLHGFREILTSPFTPHAYTNRAPIDVDAAEVRGRFSWLGVSMTDSSCWLLSRLSAEQRRRLLEAVFSPRTGAGLRGVRLNIGSSDYATAIYNYNETPGDVEMRRFSVARDDNWVFPMVKAAQEVNPDIFVFAAPWSPPGWMKTTGNFIDGHFKDGCEQAYANYLAAYVRECARRGIAVRAVTAQNEAALSTHGTYPSCVFSAEQEATVAKLLAAKLQAENLPAQVWLWDWNYADIGDRLTRQLGEMGLSKVVRGIAWHSYSDGEEKMRELKKAYPEIPFYHTEMGPAKHDPRRNEQWWAGKIRRAFENGCQSYTGWNLCLDPDGQPLVGPHLCMGLVTVDPETGDFTPSAQYNVFRHIGPFVREGAEVLRAEGDRDGMETLLFRNPDGEHVLVCVGNAGEGLKGRRWNEPRPKIYVRYAGENKYLPLPHGTWSVTTMVFRKRPAKEEPSRPQ